MPDPTEETKPQVRINVPLDRDLHTELKIRAAAEHTELKDLVPRLLRLALDLPRAPKGGA